MRVSSKEETQAWRQSLREWNTTNVLIVEKWIGLGGVSQCGLALRYLCVLCVAVSILLVTSLSQMITTPYL